MWLAERQQGLLFEPTLEKQGHEWPHRHWQEPGGKQTNTGALVDAASATLLHHSRTIAKGIQRNKTPSENRTNSQSRAQRRFDFLTAGCGPYLPRISHPYKSSETFLLLLAFIREVNESKADFESLRPRILGQFTEQERTITPFDRPLSRSVGVHGRSESSAS